MKNIKKELSTAFNPPPPTRKAEFLQAFEYPRTGRPSFITAQVSYIRKRIWAISFLIVVAVIFMLHHQDHQHMWLWVVSSFLPFFALMGITEIAKSMSFNMAELEMSCKHSLADITLARLGIIGGVNATTLTAITLLLSQASGMNMPTLVVHMFTPYLLACALSLFAINRFRGRERLYICGGVACVISVASIVIFGPFHISFASESWLPWAFAIFLTWTCAEVFKLIKNMEDNQWNLSLTA